MGLFKDLGFVNQGGVITAPDCQLLDGMTATQLQDSIIGGLTFTADGQVTIPGSLLPYTMTQDLLQTPWKKYQVVATNAVGDIKVNDEVQIVESTATFGEEYTNLGWFNTDAKNRNPYLYNATKTYDFGSYRNIIDFTTAASATNPSGFPTYPYTLYSSNDGVNWTVILQTTITTSSVVTHTLNVIARYLKITSNSYVFVTPTKGFHISSNVTTYKKQITNTRELDITCSAGSIQVNTWM